MYDFVTDGDKTTKHIDSYAGPDVVSNSPLHVQGYTWPFTDEIDGTQADVKQWIPGTHKFFGWLAKDATLNNTTPESFFGEGFGFSETNMTLSIPAKEMTKATPQFDFLYSDIVTVDPQNAPVPLEFKHLFTAFCITAKKNVETAITITKITLSGLHNNKSATIDFSGNATARVYNDSGNYGQNYGQFEFVQNFTIGTTETNLTATYLMWPQTPGDIINTENTSDDDAKISIEYIADSKTQEPRTFSLRSLVGDNPDEFVWEPGKINKINIVFDVNQITFIIDSIIPWNSTEKDIPVQL